MTVTIGVAPAAVCQRRGGVAGRRSSNFHDGVCTSELLLLLPVVRMRDGDVASIHGWLVFGWTFGEQQPRHKRTCVYTCASNLWP